MKRVLAILILTMSAISVAYSQEADTIKKVTKLKVFQIKDSLLKDKRSMRIDFVYPRHKDLEKFNSTFLDKQITFRANKITQKTRILNSYYSKIIIPTIMISYGLITIGSKPLQELDYSTNNEINEHLKVPIPIDDYSQYAPAVAVYGLDFTGIKAKHNFRDRTMVMATSYIIMGATVQTMKGAFNVERPDRSNNRSFPSGHTATAFVGAHILFKEYKDTSPWIGIAGYAIAAVTGSLRVLNKKHWISDVVTGAGVGILSVEAGYLLLPVFHNIFDIKNRNNSLVVSPSIGVSNYGIGLVYTF